MNKKKIHLIGNAHLDPVWLWRFGDGLSEIKATFRSALDRIAEFDEFIFTSACAFYYKWVEENCPEMFSEIQKAVADGKWKLVGGMWVQPDCNMPSTESFARHFLYSQRYFLEKFGVIAKTGYNVDSFGHTAAMPTLLRNAGMENYVYMRPDDGLEMQYPFKDNAFRWRHGESEVLAYHLNRPYCSRALDEDEIKLNEELAEKTNGDYMMFFGVGNHGGGPTVRQIKLLMKYREDAKSDFIFSDPDTYFDSLRKDGKYDSAPLYVGELQNHASGCYSANSQIKMLNRKCESVLKDAEALSALASDIAGHATDKDALKDAWQALLFNQFHDVLCGCSIKAAYSDAYAYLGGAIGEGCKQLQSSAQRISWAVDTSKGVKYVSKEGGSVLWEKDDLGTPIVIFNPLSHALTVPVTVSTYGCTAVTDPDDKPVAFQFVDSEYERTSPTGMRALRFFANVEPLGYATYWVYEKKEYGSVKNTAMSADLHRLANERVEVLFDEKRGCIKSYKTLDGRVISERPLSRAVVIDDSENDTWSHGHFVFDQIIGEFSDPEFTVIDNGDCQVSLLVKTKYKASTLEQIFTLYSNDDRIHVKVRLTLNERLVSVKLCFDSGLEDAEWVREIPGGVLNCTPNGREEPMLRYMMLRKQSEGIAIVNNGKYSSSASDGEMRMVAARSCFYADHSGERKILHSYQDIGENEFKYVIMAHNGSTLRPSQTADELCAEFVTVNETYHKGRLPTRAGYFKCDGENISVFAIKDAEDGKGRIIRVCETSGAPVKCTAELMGTRIPIELSAYAIGTYRIYNETVTKVDFTEL